MGNSKSQSLAQSECSELIPITSGVSYRDALMDHFPSLIQRMEHSSTELKSFLSFISQTRDLYTNMYETFDQKNIKALKSGSADEGEYGVFGKVVSEMRQTSSQLKSSCTELATLSNDSKALSDEFNSYLKKARKEEKKLSEEVSTFKKNYEKALKKEESQKATKLELERMLTLSEKPLSNQEKEKLERKLRDLEPALEKLESDNRLLLLKFQEREEVYKIGLGNILSHLEFIDRKRFSLMKELTKRLLEILKTVGACISDNAAQVNITIKNLEDEKVFANFVASCRNEVFIPAATTTQPANEQQQTVVTEEGPMMESNETQE
ncbi:hypothetical protein C9374_014250 [Naegleria lovaniensis]|uniref:Uncharacterized protein n=1 Tax=Naegleria lovaniensis TaxID=51637 RepID=A0AA88GBD2_NAELO|nr:uncharacterized protein C9374_014250 [Naegleria lovaniensis]KAG2370756.1 hypothetical protein C9374_014250 [Naegleria lovaniensis]